MMVFSTLNWAWEQSLNYVGMAKENDKINLRFFFGKTTSTYEDIPLSESTRLLEMPQYDSNKNIMFYFHGYIENMDKESVQTVVKAELDKGDRNVVAIDWSKLAEKSYPVAAYNTIKVGSAVAEVIDKLIEKGLPLKNIHLVGHSLGSHVASKVGRSIQAGKVPRITGLDPALPLFYPGFKHLNSSDALFVDIIHTDAGIYGTYKDTGDVDFYPNGGTRYQPGCRFTLRITSDDDFCSHWRSWLFYAESISEPEAFPAVKAESWADFKNGKLLSEEPIYMGYATSNNARGKYFLRTNSKPPFGLKLKGLQQKK